MADMRVKYLATSVQMQMHLSVFLPETVVRDPAAHAGRRLKTLWLLHGEGGDCTDWSRLSMVEHHAQEAGIALVMPSLDNSMYMDMAHGGYPYFSYLMEDLPRHIRNLVRVLSDRPQDNFVAGVGVGGYGALKWLLRAPGSFAAAASLSGPLDIVGKLRRLERASGALPDDWAAAFGSAEAIEGTPDDLIFLARQAADAGRPPARIFIASSARDEGGRDDIEAARTLARLGLDVMPVHEAPAAQGWPFWDSSIRAFIEAAVAPCRKGGA